MTQAKKMYAEWKYDDFLKCWTECQNDELKPFSALLEERGITREKIDSILSKMQSMLHLSEIAYLKGEVPFGEYYTQTEEQRAEIADSLMKLLKGEEK